MRTAIIGCGYVADYYLATAPLHPEIELVGVHDRDPERLAAFTAHHQLHAFESLDALLDSDAELVLNLTNPRSHAEVSRACLEAGRHVYSEKPLAMDLGEARELVELAASRDLQISAAPCSLLGEAAQTLWRCVRDATIGRVRLVYAELDEGPMFRMPYRRWVSASGAPWPYHDEFEVGTVVEHAGYVVSWLPAMFGRATRITGLATVLVQDKGVEPPLRTQAPDLSVACIEFESGVVARVTCSMIAPHDHSLRMFGDGGAITLEDTWDYTSAIRRRRWVNLRGRHVRLPDRRVKLMSKGQRYEYRGTQQMDFCRGVADLVTAIRTGRAPRLSATYSLHINELVLAMHHALTVGGEYAMTTPCDQPSPLGPEDATLLGAAPQATPA